MFPLADGGDARTHELMDAVLSGGLVLLLAVLAGIALLGLGLWGSVQLLSGKGRFAPDTNRALGLLKMVLALCWLGALVVPALFLVGLICSLGWGWLEWKLRRAP